MLIPSCSRDLYKTTQNVTFKFRDETYLIPEGFQFNGASIPALFWRLFYSPFHPRVIVAALLHDAAYRYHTTYLISRADADRVFYRALRQADVPVVKRVLMWAAVRLFGWMTWWYYTRMDFRPSRTMEDLDDLWS